MRSIDLVYQLFNLSAFSVTCVCCAFSLTVALSGQERSVDSSGAHQINHFLYGMLSAQFKFFMLYFLYVCFMVGSFCGLVVGFFFFFCLGVVVDLQDYISLC